MLGEAGEQAGEWVIVGGELGEEAGGARLVGRAADADGGEEVGPGLDVAGVVAALQAGEALLAGLLRAAEDPVVVLIDGRCELLLHEVPAGAGEAAREGAVGDEVGGVGQGAQGERLAGGVGGGEGGVQGGVVVAVGGQLGADFTDEGRVAFEGEVGEGGVGEEGCEEGFGVGAGAAREVGGEPVPLDRVEGTWRFGQVGGEQEVGAEGLARGDLIGDGDGRVGSEAGEGPLEGGVDVAEEVAADGAAVAGDQGWRVGAGGRGEAGAEGVEGGEVGVGRRRIRGGVDERGGEVGESLQTGALSGRGRGGGGGEDRGDEGEHGRDGVGAAGAAALVRLGAGGLAVVGEEGGEQGGLGDEVAGSMGGWSFVGWLEVELGGELVEDAVGGGGVAAGGGEEDGAEGEGWSVGLGEEGGEVGEALAGGGEGGGEGEEAGAAFGGWFAGEASEALGVDPARPGAQGGGQVLGRGEGEAPRGGVVADELVVAGEAVEVGADEVDRDGDLEGVVELAEAGAQGLEIEGGEVGEGDHEQDRVERAAIF